MLRSTRFGDCISKSSYNNENKIQWIQQEFTWSVEELSNQNVSSAFSSPNRSQKILCEPPTWLTKQSIFFHCNLICLTLKLLSAICGLLHICRWCSVASFVSNIFLLGCPDDWHAQDTCTLSVKFYFSKPIGTHSKKLTSPKKC